MSHTIQEFFAVATQKAANDLKTALLRLPEDKRSWAPAESSRTALDQAAECAILNGLTANLVETQQWPQGDMGGFEQGKQTLAQEEEKLLALLDENTQKFIAVIRAVPEDALDTPIKMPWGTQTLVEIIAYPCWNMSYHEGQINYIASMLNLLK